MNDREKASLIFRNILRQYSEKSNSYIFQTDKLVDSCVYASFHASRGVVKASYGENTVAYTPLFIKLFDFKGAVVFRHYYNTSLVAVYYSAEEMLIRLDVSETSLMKSVILSAGLRQTLSTCILPKCEEFPID